jgi:abelson tyrosine-protein kinase 1
MELNVNIGMTRDLLTMASQSSTMGGWEMEQNGDGSQSTAEPNFIPQPSTSPDPLSNYKEIKLRTHTSKDTLPEKVS